MKLLLISFILSNSFLALGQLKYNCIFNDTVGVANYQDQISQIRQQLRERGLPEDVIERFIDTNYPNIQSFSHYMRRTIKVTGDTSIISLDYSNTKNTPGNFILTTIGYMVVKGDLYRLDPDDNTYKKTEVPEYSRFFNYTGNSEEIIGYKCKEFISKDSLYRIYINEELPASINPGISIQNISGAVLGFKFKTEKITVISIINKLEILKVAI
jgi:hypothetical protein